MSVIVLHETDLFRPHEDPDDHWDLACQFALAKKGYIALKGILIDYPPNAGYGDPDIIAVAQLNYITGGSVPVGIGQTSLQREESSGVRMIRQVLEAAEEPVVLHIVGSSRDIARCGRQNPDLFRRKVRAIYLNAGSGKNGTELEYNVRLDVASYAAIFDLPCPIYWMPCFDTVSFPMRTGKFGTYFRFRQEDVWNDLDDTIQNYFIGALARKQDSNWLRMLKQPVDTSLLAYYGATYRNMWCTGGFLHAAGLTVLKDGSIVPLSKHPLDEAYRFVPVHVTCDEHGYNHWHISEENTNRYIFQVNDEAGYQSAMTQALHTMLSWL